jgi:hypothetical protein
MKSKTRLQRISVLVVAMLSLVAFSFIGIGASCGASDPEQYYSNNTQTTPVAGGGSLKAFVERQTYGSYSGANLSIRYKVQNDYTGSGVVTEIKATWTVNAQYWRLTGSSYSAGLTMGSTSAGGEVGSGSTNDYVTYSAQLYFTNTNGAKQVYYGPSNYVMWPNDQIRSHSIQNEAYLKMKNNATTYRITAAV